MRQLEGNKTANKLSAAEAIPFRSVALRETARSVLRDGLSALLLKTTLPDSPEDVFLAQV